MLDRGNKYSVMRSKSKGPKPQAMIPE